MDTRNLRVEGRCDHTYLDLPGTCVLVASWEVNLQPAPVHRRPAENLPPAATSATGRKSSAGPRNRTFGTPPSRGTLNPTRVRPRIVVHHAWVCHHHACTNQQQQMCEKCERQLTQQVHEQEQQAAHQGMRHMHGMTHQTN